MAIPVNLAMTGAEIARCCALPPQPGWMACQFSPWSPGLSNFPEELPPDSLLILNDQTPIHGHDPDRIRLELEDCIRRFSCAGLLLDFQRPENPETAALVDALTALPCPVAVTAPYAQGTNTAVFLAPLPCHVSLTDWTAPWAGRDLWLEIALDREIITLTARGAEITSGDFAPKGGFADKHLHCHYTAAVQEQTAVFSLWRTEGDLAELLQEAGALGIRAAVGLYQELGAAFLP